MPSPTLRPLAEVPPELAAQLPVLPAEGFEIFLVTGAGAFGDQRYLAGEVVLCRGEARTGDTTVLVARGVGRPRLGTVEGLRFRGDGGEPCHPARWRSAGKLVARFTRTGLDPADAQWLVEVGARIEPRRPAVAADRRTQPAQLSLFAAA